VVVVLLIVIVVISAVLVRIAAFALELTGMSWDDAKFQALSAFTNSGFTTRAAEQVMVHPVRRRIVSTLITLGNAGLVTAIGTFAGSIMKEDLETTLLNVAVLLGAVAALFLFTRWQAPMSWMRRVMKRWMSRYFDFQPPNADQLLRLDEGYQLTRIELTADSPAANKALQDIDLKSWRVQVLAIESGGQFNPVPMGRDRLLPGDGVIVYGAAEAVNKVFKPRSSTRLTIMGMQAPEV
jgi:Trk-type K+ transport system membrane component